MNPRRIVGRLRRALVQAIRRVLHMVLGKDSPLHRLPDPVKDVLRAVRRRTPDRLVRAVARPARPGAGGAPAPVAADLPPRPPVPDTPVRLLVGPANFAGQGYEWSNAAARHLPGVGSQAFAVVKGRLDFPVDYGVPAELYTSLLWQRDQERHVTASYTHVLIEAERPVLGPLYGRECSGEIPVLRRAGLQVGLISHGSDVRVPSHHAARYEWSPFTDEEWEAIPILEANARRNAATLNGYDGYVFVSTPDLLDDVPGAIWCPVVVDLERWASDHHLMERDVPVVVHVPSSSKMKGSELIDPIVSELAEAGLIEYRRIHDVPPEQMPSVYQSADIVLDQFRLGSYGVASCEGMAAGRVVVGHVVEEVRERVRAGSGHDLPIVEATPATLREVLERLVAERDDAREQARKGVEFVRGVHDGRLSARALAPFLGVTATS